MTLICRLCASLRKIETFVHIRDPHLNLCLKLEKCCGLFIIPNDPLPQNVCNECVRCLDECWKFNEKVRESQESLQKIFLDDNCDILGNRENLIYQKLSTPVVKKQILNLKTDTIDNSQVLPNSTITTASIDDIKKFDEIEVIEEYDDSDLNVEEIQISEIQFDDTTEILSQDDEEEEIEHKLVDIDYSPTSPSLSPNPSIVVPQDENNESWSKYPWHCSICTNLTFDNVTELRQHFCNIHSDDNSEYVCVDCSRNFDKYYTFINHVRSRHRKGLSLCCDYCSEFLPDFKMLSNHRTIHNDDDSLILCPICGKSFKNSCALQVHSTCHQPDDIKYKFACEICDKKFAKKANLKAHQKIHSGIKEFVCDQCGKGFVQKANLEEHLLTHINHTPFECQECGKTFKTPARLTKHKSVHSDVKSFKCDECGRLFREKDTLRVHFRIHTGAMPFTCEFCGKKFRFKSILTTHRHQHTGERPYSCLECNHHFTNWPNYNKHMKRRHGIDTSLTARKSRTITSAGSSSNS